MTSVGIPTMADLGPVVDQFIEIASEELPTPQTMRVKLWDNGAYYIEAFHAHADERWQLTYDRETGAVVRRYECGRSWEAESIAETEGTRYTSVYEEEHERVITTIDPPDGIQTDYRTRLPTRSHPGQSGRSRLARRAGTRHWRDH